MTDLSGAGVRVLLLATARHDGPTLPSVPSVAPTFHALRTALTECCGVPPEQVRAELDPPDARFMAQAVAEEAQRAGSVLLVHFVGHGLLDADGELYLAARATDRLTPGLAAHQALSFSALRQALLASRAPSVVLVLDCCFSGRPAFGSAIPLPAFGMDPAPGLYFIGSAEQLALASPDAERTAFTGALIDVLTHGDPHGPHPMTLDSVYDAVFRTLRGQQAPLPRRQAEGLSGNLVVAPNPMVAGGPRPDDPPPAPGRSPYPGLNAFEPDEARLFCGRERMVDRLLAEISRPETSGGPWLLVGPSGAGKTSLLNAGLLDRLRDDGLPGSSGWPVLRLTPGAGPLRRLADLLDARPEDVELLRTAPHGAPGLLRRLLADRPGQRLVLLVDQLEEIFTLCRDDAERSVFLGALGALAEPPASSGPSRALVVLALRADFYGRAAAEPRLVPALRDRAVLVEPMTAGELRAAIEEPAARSGLQLDDGLADLMLHEFGAMRGDRPVAGALPLLAHALWATWRRRAGTRLTIAGYRATGGIAQAIATTADEVYESLDPESRHAVRHILTRLVRVGDGAPDTARPMDRSTVVRGLPEEPARAAIELLTTRRLLTLDQDTARISHEALIRAWPRLRTWVDNDREWLRLRQRLADDATAWDRSGHDPSLLYRGSRLAALLQYTENPPVRRQELEPPLAAFAEASARLERQGVRRRRTIVAVLTVLLVLASAGLVGSVAFQRQAERAHHRDLARYLAAEAENLRTTQPGLAKQLSLLSFRMNEDAGLSALLASRSTPGVINRGEAARDLASSADGRVLAISTGDAIVLRTRDGTTRIPAGVTGPVVVSRDGRRLAAVTYAVGGPRRATVRLWDLARPAYTRRTATLRTGHPVGALALGTDGRVLYGAGPTGQVLRWDLGHGTEAPTALAALGGKGGRIDSLAVSPRRNLLAAMSTDGTVRLWDVADADHPEPVATLTGAPYTPGTEGGLLHRVAFDRTGRLLAAPMTAAHGADLGLWRVGDPRRPRRIHREDEDDEFPTATCSADLTSLAFSPAADQIVGVCDTNWQTWAYATDSPTGLIVPGAQRGGPAMFGTWATIMFDPARSRRLLLATDHGVLVWYLSNLMQPGADATLLPPPGTGSQVAFRAAGRRQLVAWKGAGVNYLFDVTSLRKRAALVVTPAPDMYTSPDITLSADGRLLADSEIRTRGKQQYVGVALRDTTRRGVPLISTIIDELHNGVQVLAFSPTEPLLVVSDLNGFRKQNHRPAVVRLFDIKDPRHPRQVGRIAATSTELTFSPDGRTLVVADSPWQDASSRPAAGIRLTGWDITDPAHPARAWERRLPASVDSMHLAFRPDGGWLAVYRSDGTLEMWPVRGNRPAGAAVKVQIGQFGGALAFSPDGTRLALIATTIPANDGTRPEIWDVRDPRHPARQSYLTPDSAGQFYALTFSPDGRRLAVVRGGAGVDLWDLTPAPVISDLCNSVGTPITRTEWRRYLPDRLYRPPCGQDP
ncbi:AAA family ATPase [Streptomyces sp. NPDC017405]|uniref:caspase, EACC1-associated type n=1 Tax=unclassified Streptomyces TaxID=2593676 RepID=UPI0037AC6491